MRKTVIISSALDPGGSNIRQRLIENFPFKETDVLFDSFPVYEYSHVSLVSTKKETVRIGPEIDTAFGREGISYVFISKHWAESQIPSLTAHFTGNFGTADFGGNTRELSKHSPSLLKEYMISLLSLKETIPQKYNLTLEATHHGPTDLKYPSMFVELGSALQEWNDPEGGSCVASALMSALSKEKTFDKCAIGLGGTHYPQKFNELDFESEIALGIIAPKYALDHVDEEMIRQAIEKSAENITIAAIDTKGLGKNKSRILDLVGSIGLEPLKV